MLAARTLSKLLHTRAWGGVVVVLALALALVGASSAAAARRSVTVMTQNLYQGTEFRHFARTPSSK